VPLALLDTTAELVPAQYRHALMVVRADPQVAWRSDAPARARRGFIGDAGEDFG
jgi:hypothetical protein